MNLAYFIYISLLIFMTGTSWLYTRVVPSQKQILLAISVFIFSVVLGMRYQVGTDYASYMDIYKFHTDFDIIEPGYRFLNIILSDLGFSYPSIFIAVAFLQIIFFTKGIIRFGKIFPWTIFFYFTTLYIFLSLNVLRQTLAFSIFVFSIQFIWKKKFLKYCLCILFSSLFHQSAMILLPF